MRHQDNLGRSRNCYSLQKLEQLEARYLLTTVSGAINTDAVWNAAGSPYEVIGTVTVSAAATLEIEPGVVVEFADNTGLEIDGRLIADGSPSDRITFRPSPTATDWNGFDFQNTLADNRIGYSDVVGGDANGQVIHVDHARLGLDNIVWTGNVGTILELNHPSLIVRNSHFPATDAVNAESAIRGQGLQTNERLIVEGNTFENSNHRGTVIEYSSAHTALGPVVQILNNAFLGGGGDGVDLDSANAHIEGNLFNGFHRDAANTTTANAIVARSSSTLPTIPVNATVVRNIFRDSDYALLVDDMSSAVVEQNLFEGIAHSVIQFDEILGPPNSLVGQGATLDGNIFTNLLGTPVSTQLFANLSNMGGFQTMLEVNNSLLPNQIVDFDGAPVSAHILGTGNIDADPAFVDTAAANYRLSPNSPAIAAGPNGLDMGPYVPVGPSVTGVPYSTSEGDNLVFQVAGPGIHHYRYRLDDGSGTAAFGPVTPITTAIQLTDLATADYTLDVIGRNSAGEWYAGQTPAFRENTAEIIAPNRTRAGEMLPIVVRVRDSHDAINALLTAPSGFANAADLADTAFEIKKGVGTLSPLVTATGDFALGIDDQISGQFGAELAASPIRNVQVLDASFPVQTYGGTLTGDIVWDADTEHQITSDLTIRAGSSLTINAGTRILLGDEVNIDILGAITVVGTQLEPVVFNSLSAAQPWGGIELLGGATGTFDYAFFTNAAADSSRNFGHSSSQPVIYTDGGTLNFTNSFILNTVGKAFGSSDARINIDQSIASHVDTGAQFDNSVVTATNTYLKDVPNGDGVFDDDDNDGFYFLGYHSSGEYSTFQDSFIISTKDDGIDHNGARLNVVSSWIENALHEGIATSNSNFANVFDSVVTRSNQGIEAGYGGPNVTIENTVVFNNDSIADAASPINAGIRFGDGYDGGNGAYNGHITASNNVVHDNTENVRNWDGSVPGPQAGAIDITYSMTNDPAYDTDVGNFTGMPVFGPYMHLLRGSAGIAAGSDGENVGRVQPSWQATFEVIRPDATAPPAVTNLAGQTTGPGQATLTWDATIDPESGTDYYNVYRDGQWIGTTDGADANPEFSDNSATPGVIHVYSVTTVNGVGTEGPSATLPLVIESIVVFQDGQFPSTSYSGTSDVWIRGSEPDTPLGGETRIDADGSASSSLPEWSLIRWDLSSIAAGADVMNVELQVTVNNASPNDYDMYAVTRDWVETQATYNQFATGQAWEIPGTGPTDRGALVGVLNTGGSTGNHTVTLNASGIALVQSWVNTPSSNHGLIFYSPGSNDGLEMRSREYATVAQRPRLTIGLNESSNAIPGDYNRNGIVDQLDHDLWRSTFGNTTILYADGNSNGIVDAADFPYWRDRLGNPAVLATAASSNQHRQPRAAAPTIPAVVSEQLPHTPSFTAEATVSSAQLPAITFVSPALPTTPEPFSGQISLPARTQTIVDQIFAQVADEESDEPEEQFYFGRWHI